MAISRFGEELVDGCGGDDLLAPAGVEAFEIDFLCFEIFGDEAEGIALDAGVDVLGDEDDAFAFVEEGDGAADDAVVGCVGGEAGAEFLILLEDDADAATGLGDGDAVGESALEAEGIEMSDDGAGVSAEVVGVGFEFVQLFDDVEGDDHFVVGEHEERIGIVEEDVGIDDEGFGVAVGLAHFFRIRSCGGIRHFRIVASCELLVASKRPARSQLAT